jgi:transglutaminase-like putative cysteine protease
MNYRVTHSTRYEYSADVGICWNKAILLPRETSCQKCLTSELQVTPAPAEVCERNDFFGNRVSHFAIQEPYRSLQVTAISDVAINPDPELLSRANCCTWESVRDRLTVERSQNVHEALLCLYDSKQVQRSEELADYARPSFSSGRPLGDAVNEFMQRIYTDFRYDPGVTTIATPLSEVLHNRHGVCQDFAHLGIGCLRAIGLSARYVSGYIETLPPPGQKRLVGADASHAWFSVFAGDAGWVDFDPTNNKIAAEQHVTVAWGRDFSDVSPLRGVALGGGKHKMSVSVDVARVPIPVNG